MEETNSFQPGKKNEKKENISMSQCSLFFLFDFSFLLMRATAILAKI